MRRSTPFTKVNSLEDADKAEKALRSQFKSGDITKVAFDKGQASLVGQMEGLMRGGSKIAKETAKKVASKGISREFGKAIKAGEAGSGIAKSASGMSSGQAAAVDMGVKVLVGDSKSTGSGALSGATGAMATAASFGLVDPYSQAIAGAVGGIMGGLGAKSAKKAAAAKAKAEEEAKHASNLGRIEQEKGAKIQSALQNMGEAFGRTLNSVGKDKVEL